MNFSFKKFRRIIIFVCLLATIVGLMPNLGFASEEFNYKVDLKYEVNENGNTRVSEAYQITNNSARQYLTELKITTPTDEVNNLNIKYSDGANIPYTTDKKSNESDGYQYEYIEITIKFSRQNIGKGSTWGFNIFYDTSKLVDKKGTSHTVYIPAISSTENAGDYNISLYAPVDFGNVHPSGIKPIESFKQKDKQVFVFNPREMINNPISVVFGDSTTYNVNFNFPLKNNSDGDKNFTITLPPDMPNQKIFINSLDPKPESTYLDQDGNILANYKVPPHKDIIVKTDISALVKYLEYNLSASGDKEDIPDDLVKKYTKPTQYWQSNNPDILVRAKSLSKGNINVAQVVKATDKFVIEHLSYNNEKIKYNIRQGAVKALKDPANAVCLEYSDLMIALLRAQGIPARMPIGYAYSSNLKASDSVADSLHSWVEVYVPKVGWMVVDPTWNEKFSSFGKSDMDHFAFALWGSNDNKPVAVSSSGSDQNYQYEDAIIKYLDKSPQAQLNAKISAEKYVILPFVSLIKYHLASPAEVAGDNYKLDFGSDSDKKIVDLGSLAPAQVVNSFSVMLGYNFFSLLNAKFIQSSHNSSLILAETTSKPNYLPMIGIIIIISGFVIYKLVKLVSNRRKKLARSNGQE